MINNETLALLSTVAGYSSAFLAFVAGCLSFISIKKRNRIGKICLWCGALTAIVASAFGVLSIVINEEISSRDKHFKTTHPEISASYTVRSTDPLILDLSVISKNNLPFKYNYDSYTKEMKPIKSVIHIRDSLFDPRIEREPLKMEIKLDRDKVVDGNITIIFCYKSLYSEEYFNGKGKALVISGKLSL